MPHTQDKKKSIKALIELNEELENYFRNTIIPQLFVDANLILRKFTPPAMKQFEFSADHIGKPMAELVDNIRYSTIMENISEVIASEEILEKEIQTTDMRWFQMNIVPYIDSKNNKPNGVIITFVDITERIKDLRELERMNAYHSTFIFSVTHDLKAPLANIEGLVRNIIDTTEQPGVSKKESAQEQKVVAELLFNSLDSMRTIIDELAQISKVEGRYKESIECVNIEKIIGAVEMTLRDKINESYAEIVANIAIEEIQFSRKNLRSIFYNLLSNAIKYRKPDIKPEITITTGMDGDYVKITVSDNGIGIPDDKTEAIFDQYTRLDQTSEGAGVGLYLVKKIVENSGGKINVTSKEGKGSTFEVFLKPEKE